MTTQGKGAPDKLHLEGSDLLEIIQETVRQIVSQMALEPESCTFSGKATDVIARDDRIYLRLSRTSVVDEEGKPHELIARLCGHGGVFSIPAVETEVLVFHLAGAKGIAGSAWCLFGSFLPAGANVGNIKPGRTVILAQTGPGKITLSESGAVTMETADADGRAVYSRVSPTEVRTESPWGKTLLSIAGFQVLIPGARFAMTAVGLPAPFGLVSSFITLRAGSLDLCGTGVTRLGPGPWFSVGCSPTPGPFGLAGFGSTNVLTS